ncbi:MAG: hypothetical protein IJ087_22490, partial [Eggerthellaceae bacterium]|nr:hypothetical protein [Eggerthellaceae bacterium]
NVVSKGASYELTSSTLLDTGELLVAPNVGMTPEGGKADSHVLCWSNLPEEVGFTNINEDSSISVASSTGGVTAQVAAGSEMIVNVSDEDSNSVEIMQPTGSSFAVEYFNESGEDITISGEGDQLVSTSQAGDNLVVSGVTSLTVAGASGAKTVSSLDSGKTYTVIVDDSGSSSKVALGDLKNASVSLTGSFTFTGKAHTPKPTVSYAGKELVENTDYKLAYASNVNAGTAKVVITGIGDYGGAQESSFTISRAANPMQAKAVAKKVSLKGAKKLKKSKAVAGAVKFTKKAIGEVTYARVSKGSSKWLSVAKSTGKVTVKKGAPKGIYKMKVNVKAAGSGNYKAATKALTVKVVVK